MADPEICHDLLFRHELFRGFLLGHGAHLGTA
jgi:hypothetical protein